MSIININNLTFSYDTSYENIFENVSFSIDTDWKTGFVGRNGRGKTTFLNLLMGKYQYGGSISHSVKFEYFPFEISDKTKNTIDAVFEIEPDFEHWALKRELNLLEVAEDCLYRPFYTLSNGEQSKVLLAALFLKENNFLLIDEPTNHLDIIARRTVSRYLKDKKSFILVSHDKCFLDDCVDHILSINKTNIEVQNGNFSGWLINKERQDSFELAENQKLESDIERLKKSAKRTAEWSQKGYRDSTGRQSMPENKMGYKEFQRKKAEKLDNQVKAFQNRQNNAIENKSKLLKNIEKTEILNIFPLKHYCERLVDAKNLSVHYEDKTIFIELNFEINQGDRIAVCGKNGCGKTSLIKLLCGENINYSGNLSLASNIKISYVSQDTSALGGDLKNFAHQNNIDESLFKTILSKFDFSRVQFEKNINEFSDGQKKKVLIAKSLCENAHIYIWDEPLNYIDILSRIQIENLILKNKPTMLFVEHDRAFLEKISTKIIEL